MLSHYKRVIRKDANLIVLVLIFIGLGIVATMLANQSGYLQY